MNHPLLIALLQNGTVENIVKGTAGRGAHPQQQRHVLHKAERRAVPTRGHSQVPVPLRMQGPALQGTEPRHVIALPKNVETVQEASNASELSLHSPDHHEALHDSSVSWAVGNMLDASRR